MKSNIKWNEIIEHKSITTEYPSLEKNKLLRQFPGQCTKILIFVFSHDSAYLYATIEVTSLFLKSLLSNLSSRLGT